MAGLSLTQQVDAPLLDAAAAFVAHLQSCPEDAIAYFGETVEDIRGQMLAFAPHPERAVIVALADGQIVGLLGVDVDAEVRRAWLYGPLAAGVDWHSTADALYSYAHDYGLLSEAREHELFASIAHTNMAAFAARHGFTARGAEAGLRLERAALNRLPHSEADVLGVADHEAFAALHDTIFPGTYYSGQEIVARLGERDRVFVHRSREALDGYIYAKLDPGAESGYIDFLGVAEDARRRGIGRRLVAAAARWLFTFVEAKAVELTVNAANTGAIALYQQLGFTLTQTLQPYRKSIQGV